jgi:hypothetical protein
VIECSPASDQPREQDALAPVAIDDSDDGSDALIAPAPPRVRLLTYGESAGSERRPWVSERALMSHAPSLERPPRA